MIRHIVLFRWKEGTTPEQIAAALTGLRALPAQIPQIRAYVVGADIGGMDGHWDVAVTGDFDDLAAFRAYFDHPAHQAVVHERILPIREARAVLQVDLDQRG
ncbi:MAG: Dabb family protein [Chloroflexota bacterium]